MRAKFALVAVIGLAAVAGIGWWWPPFWWAYLLVGPLVGLGIHDVVQTKHTIRRNYPVIGHGRWIMESLRPPLHQYFVESDLDGVPVNRMFRSVVYQRSKRELDTLPFGTRIDVYRVGYEWINHSLHPCNLSELEGDPRVLIGADTCKNPYSASIFNVSAMSFGALSENAIKALNGGAKLGGFFHNTGEGGLSPHHLAGGGDLVWQVGTAYFGCRDARGHFDPQRFREKARLKSVKMVELKLSQGAKPSHGGILPACKNTPEIAKIRGVTPHTQVDSPPRHTAFDTPAEMMEFLQKLRELAGDKPVGFKLCLGRKEEFVALCRAMVETGLWPDFITVDGAEGGTGAAPLEYSNSVGTPLREGLAFVVDCLRGFDLQGRVRVIASGKIFTGFHLVKHLALGADLCNSARGMMLALGCIQALECNTNACPTGVATQDPRLVRGLVVADKQQRVANFHRETVHSVVELVAAVGLRRPAELSRAHLCRRINPMTVHTYEEIYPSVEPGCLLKKPYPERFRPLVEELDKARLNR